MAPASIKAGPALKERAVESFSTAKGQRECVSHANLSSSGGSKLNSEKQCTDCARIQIRRTRTTSGLINKLQTSVIAATLVGLTWPGAHCQNCRF
jgi:hypothetical protein